MDFRFTPEQEAWRQEVREFLREAVTPQLKADIQEMGPPEVWGEESKKFIKKLGEKGWLAANWPKEYGGAGKSTVDYYILLEELAYVAAPTTQLTVTSVGPTIMRVGTEQQKEKWLLPMARGEVNTCIGYSEPNAGTDLASLQIRGVLDGDQWVINGQKIWTTDAHRATHVWLATRTDPNVPKHKGVSLIIVPIDDPGITIRPLYTMGDGRTNETFYDNVRVPRENLIGEVNRGWYYVMMALDFERIFTTSPIVRMFNELVRYCQETRLNGITLAKDPVVRHRLCELAVEVEVCKMFGYRIAWLIDKGLVPNYESSQIKIFASELMARLADIGMQIMGLYGQLNKDSKWVPISGLIERQLRNSPPMRFGGGTNEIQRDIIARRGFGLPR